MGYRMYHQYLEQDEIKEDLKQDLNNIEVEYKEVKPLKLNSMKEIIEQIKKDYTLTKKTAYGSTFFGVSLFFKSFDEHKVKALANELVTESPERKCFPVDSYTSFNFTKKS